MSMIYLVLLGILVGQAWPYLDKATVMEGIFPVQVTMEKEFIGPLLHHHYHNQQLHVSFQCDALFNSILGNKTAGVWPPPRHPPAELLRAYTFNGVIPLLDGYYAERQNGGDGYDWPKSLIEKLGSQHNTCGGYGLDICGQLIDKYKLDFIKGKTGMVFGSQTPWAEAALLVAGEASHITTVEYMEIKSGHPQLSAYRPTVLATEFVAGKVDPVDFAFSFSSFEHDGLGRYGDPLNPSGDLEYIARVHCLLKPGGIFFLGFPVGPDALLWNAHRIYGRHRLTVVLANWEVLDVIGASIAVTERSRVGSAESQPIFVLRKRDLVHPPGAVAGAGKLGGV